MRTNSNCLYRKKLGEEVLKGHNLLITELLQSIALPHYSHWPKLIISIILLKPYRLRAQGDFDLFHS